MSTRRAPVNVETREKLYEGKAKIVYATDPPGLIVQYFKDDATAFNALKRGTIVGKGVVNNRMSAAMFARLERAKVPTHYLGTLSDREMLCRDRKSTRLNSSHSQISYAVFCLKKKKKIAHSPVRRYKSNRNL